MDLKLFCPRCGKDFTCSPDKQGQEVRCPHCGNPIQIPIVTPSAAPPFRPSGEGRRPPPETPREAPPRRPAGAPLAVQASGAALLSLASGLAGLFCGWSCCGGALPVVAIVSGHVALYRIGRQPGLAGRRFAVIGLLAGYLGLVLMILFRWGGDWLRAVLQRFGLAI